MSAFVPLRQPRARRLDRELARRGLHFCRNAGIAIGRIILEQTFEVSMRVDRHRLKLPTLLYHPCPIHGSDVLNPTNRADHSSGHADTRAFLILGFDDWHGSCSHR